MENEKPVQKIYVGNLPFSVSDEDLNEMFLKFGEIVSSRISFDKYSGRPSGFGFVTFSERDNAEKAVKEMNGTEFQGRKLRTSLLEVKSSTEKI